MKCPHNYMIEISTLDEDIVSMWKTHENCHKIMWTRTRRKDEENKTSYFQSHKPNKVL